MGFSDEDRILFIYLDTLFNTFGAPSTYKIQDKAKTKIIISNFDRKSVRL